MKQSFKLNLINKSYEIHVKEFIIKTNNQKPILNII